MKKIKIIGICLLVFIAALVGLYHFVLLPQIHLKGQKKIILDYQNKYSEKGYVASFLGKDVTKDVVVKGKVNEDKLGIYKITYMVKEGLFKKTVTRIIEVKDREKPKLNIDSSDLILCPGAEIVPAKVEAIDNYDGDISDKVGEPVISEDKSMITYIAKDSSGNITKISKKIIFEDKENPTITLNGESPMTVFVGSTFKDPGVTITDNCDKEIEQKVKVTGSVDANTIGEYELTYTVEDKQGNKAQVTRKVNVRKNSGIIYLTFDDGPNSGTTNVILDILKEEGVKATFFVTGFGPDELIKREFEEGHTVALHTNVHDYAKVYASVDAYFDDLYTIQNRVKRITGQESKIIRFPGGSSNTVSRKYSSGIMSTLVQEVQNRGFKYYDWNVSSGDAGSTTSPSGVYSNVVNSLNPNRSNMVLMHDIKTYTRDAIRDIIRYGKNNGYTFERITMDTPMVTQRVNN